MDDYVPERPIYHARMSTLSDKTTGAAGGVKGQIAWLLRKGERDGLPEPQSERDIVLEDDTSGWKEKPFEFAGAVYMRPERPQLREIFRRLRPGPDGTRENDCWYTSRLDRGMRHSLDLEEIIAIVKMSRVDRNGKPDINRGSPRVIVRSADGSLDLRTDEGIQAARKAVAAAGDYSSAISSGVRGSHERRAWEGIYHSGSHHGYVIDHSAPGRLRKIDKDARVIRRMADVILAGDSAQEVVRELIARKVPVPFKPDTWNHYMVRGILLSPVIAGKSMYLGEYVADGLWEAIITREEQERIERLLDYPRRPTYHHKPRVRHLGSGLYQCGMPECDGLMWANSMAVVPERYAGRERGYSCRVCGGQRRRISWVDADVEAQITDRLSRSDAVKFLERTQPDNEPEIAEITAQLEELVRQSREVRRRLRSKLLLPDEADEDLADIRREERELKAAATLFQPREDNAVPLRESPVILTPQRSGRSCRRSGSARSPKRSPL